MNSFNSEKEIFLNELGGRMKHLRQLRGMTLEELANKIGYSSPQARSSMQKIEAGKTDLPASKINKLATVLGVSVSFIMGFEELPLQPDALENSHILEENEVMDMYRVLDEADKGEIRGEMKHMLKADKYRAQDDGAIQK